MKAIAVLSFFKTLIVLPRNWAEFTEMLTPENTGMKAVLQYK